MSPEPEDRPEPLERPEPAWVKHAIWWRIYPLGFVGAFPEPPTGPARPGEHRLLQVIGWLDHAVALGASGVALGPIFASSTHGYDTLDHFAIDPRLGDDRDFGKLAAAAHERGLRLQLDGVFNHVGRDHPRVREALRQGPGGVAMRWFRSSADERGRVRLDTFEGHDQLVALDHDEPGVRAYVIDVMRHWLDRGADAWRLDAAYRVPAGFWAEVLPEVRRSHPDVWFEAEVIHGDYAAFVAESTADTVTQYELWKAIWSSIEHHNFFELDWALRRHNAMLATFVPATFVGNHDVTRIAGQITDSRHLPHAIALLALLGGTPTVYAGDEFGFRATKEERAGGDDAIRPAFPPLGPDAVEAADAGILRLHQRLLGLRRRHPWLHRARSRAEVLRNRQYVITLAADGHELALALNLDDAELPLPSAPILDSDAATANLTGAVAPHGWAVTSPP
ncbi:alpha-amylase family glycosyl hydrolase [[Actinomadura] parvosata]|uniref:alpha-amylase family glycosyl hydrolase n=1 Tax=[Actinomadura] parvosata TaxID=1955412 RepID=UPI00406C9403